MQNRAAWFYAETGRAQKHMQEDKKKKRWTELNGGGRRGGVGVFSVSLVDVWKRRYGTQHLPIHLPSQPDTYGRGGG
jgi:hypothetical protein